MGCIVGSIVIMLRKAASKVNADGKSTKGTNGTVPDPVPVPVPVKKTNTAAIADGLVEGVLGAAALALLFLSIRRRRRRDDP